MKTQPSIHKLQSVCLSQFGVRIEQLNPTSAFWFVDYVFTLYQQNMWRKIRNYREKFGLGTCYPVFGSKIFNTM